MTVKELIDALQGVEDQDAEIMTEGCDCYGDVARLDVTTRGEVTLMRSDPHDPPKPSRRVVPFVSTTPPYPFNTVPK